MKNKNLYETIRKFLKKTQSTHRYEHSVSVGDWAAKLGKKYGWNPERARLTGLLHDFAKEWTPAEMKKYVLARRVKVPERALIFKMSPNMLHAYVAADVVRREKWLTHKNDILAISSHTLGRPGMTLEEKILYIADFSAPGREYKAAGDIRRLAMRDLNAAFRETLADKIGRQLKKSKVIHPTPVAVWNHDVCRVRL